MSVQSGLERAVFLRVLHHSCRHGLGADDDRSGMQVRHLVQEDRVPVRFRSRRGLVDPALPGRSVFRLRDDRLARTVRDRGQSRSAEMVRAHSGGERHSSGTHAALTATVCGVSGEVQKPGGTVLEALRTTRPVLSLSNDSDTFFRTLKIQ